MRITLQSEGSDGCWFTILPSFKLRSLGDYVMAGDQVILNSTTTDLALHASDCKLNDHMDSYEVFFLSF